MFRSSVTVAASVLALVFASGSARAACQLQVFAEYHVTMDGDQPLVDATINGHPVRLVVDLGDWLTSLTGPDAKRLGLAVRTAPSGEIDLYGVGGRAAGLITHIDDFSVGPIDEKNIDMLVTGDKRMSPLAVGLLGRELLLHRDIEFDFAHGMMRFVQPKDCKGDDVVYWAQSYSVAPMLDSREGAAVEVAIQLNGHPATAMMDTGAGDSTVTTDAAGNAGVKPVTSGGKSESIGGIGAFREAYSVATFPTFSVGGETIKNAQLGVSDMFGHNTYEDVGSHIAHKLDDEPDMLLGADFFLSHRVYIARSQGKIYFTYAGGPVFQVARPRLAGELDLIIKNDDQAIAIDPTNADAFEERGGAYQTKGEVDKELADLDRAVLLKPDNGEYLNAACYGRGLAGRELDKALADCNAALRIMREAPYILDSRGLIYFRMGDLDKALADYDASVKGEPTSASSLYMRGLIKHRKGDTAGGDADIAAAEAIEAGIGKYYAKAGVGP